MLDSSKQSAEALAPILNRALDQAIAIDHARRIAAQAKRDAYADTSIVVPAIIWLTVS